MVVLVVALAREGKSALPTRTAGVSAPRSLPEAAGTRLSSDYGEAQNRRGPLQCRSRQLGARRTRGGQGRGLQRDDLLRPRRTSPVVLDIRFNRAALHGFCYPVEIRRLSIQGVSAKCGGAIFTGLRFSFVASVGTGTPGHRPWFLLRVARGRIPQRIRLAGQPARLRPVLLEARLRPRTGEVVGDGNVVRPAESRAATELRAPSLSSALGSGPLHRHCARFALALICAMRTATSSSS